MKDIWKYFVKIMFLFVYMYIYILKNEWDVFLVLGLKFSIGIFIMLRSIFILRVLFSFVLYLIFFVGLFLLGYLV